MAIVKTQDIGHAGGLFAGGTTYTLTGLTAFAAGNYVVVAIRNGNNRAVTSVTLSSAGTQTALAQKEAYSNQLALWHGFATGSETNADVVVTLAGSASDFEGVAAKVFTGFASDQSGAVSTNGTVSASTTHTIGPLTPPTANNVIIAFRERSNRTWTEDSNYTDTSMDASNFFTFGHWIQTVATARSHTMIADSAGDSFSILASFAGTPSGGGIVPAGILIAPPGFV